MRNALNLQILFARRAIVEHQDRAFAPGKELLQLQNLPPVTQRRFRQHSHFRE